jgi:hypothetical protein
LKWASLFDYQRYFLEAGGFFVKRRPFEEKKERKRGRRGGKDSSIN